MSRDSIRPGEVAVMVPDRIDAGLFFIGYIRTPYASQEDVPPQLDSTPPTCIVEIDEPWHEAMLGLETFRRIELVYWNGTARRDLVRQNTHDGRRSLGTFVTRSQHRPNPIQTAIVELLDVDTQQLSVRGLACPNGTPLLDIRPVD